MSSAADAVDVSDGIQAAERVAAGECFPADAVWGTKCSAGDRRLVEDGDPSTHPSAACWLCMTAAALAGHADELAPCSSRLHEGNTERLRVAQSAEQGLNRDSYCGDRVRADALADGAITYEHRCKDAG